MAWSTRPRRTHTFERSGDTAGTRLNLPPTDRLGSAPQNLIHGGETSSIRCGAKRTGIGPLLRPPRGPLAEYFKDFLGKT
jgi:hypothetical protein